jgi:hypothetical protein
MPDATVQNGTENGHGFRMTAQRCEAASLLAEDELTDLEIAARLGIGRNTLSAWKRHPAFSAKVAELAKDMGDRAARYAIARKTRRVAGLDDRRNRLLAVIEGRSADPSLASVPGGQTGLIVRTVKSIGGGDNAREVQEYAVDTALLKELREVEKLAAQELGQLTDHVELSGAVVVKILGPGMR